LQWGWECGAIKTDVIITENNDTGVDVKWMEKWGAWNKTWGN